MSLSSPQPEAPSTSHDRQKHPCVPCQKRKVKCDRDIPSCLNCVKAGKDCISPSSLPPRIRKKRFPEAELLARLRRYEEHLRRYGADIDAINNESLGPSKGPVKATPQQPLHEAVRTLAIRRSLKHMESNVLNGVDEEFREAQEILQGSSDDEDFESPILRTFETFDQGGGFILGEPSSQNLQELHPSTVQIFRLWQVFLDNVNPLIKLFHAPTIQQHILDASTNIQNIAKGTEAMMFGIYATAICSLSNVECVNMFGDERMTLLKTYQVGCRQALVKAGLLRTSDITILQAYVLYLISCLNLTVDPRSLFCLIGIAVRIAQRMGLNYDGTSYDLCPFEVEMRRRLWWQIVVMDFRVSEMSGAGSSVLNHVWTTKFPLNINDSDLYPDMKDTPAEYPGLTEMMYVLHRCETTSLMQNLRGSPLSLSEKAKAIDELNERLVAKYNQYGDKSVPLHLITILMTRTAISKLHMGPLHPHTMKKPSDRIFDLGLETVETHSLMMSAPKLKRFIWHIMSNVPFPAHLYVLSSLKYRTTGASVDRAWALIEENIVQREAIRDEYGIRVSSTPMALAFSNLTLKAWEARSKALPQSSELPTPTFIQNMKLMLDKRREPKPVDQWMDLGNSAFAWDNWAMQIPLEPTFDTAVYGSTYLGNGLSQDSLLAHQILN